MISFNNAARRNGVHSSYVCLSCRLKQRPFSISNGGLDADSPSPASISRARIRETRTKQPAIQSIQLDHVTKIPPSNYRKVSRNGCYTPSLLLQTDPKNNVTSAPVESHIPSGECTADSTSQFLPSHALLGTVAEAGGSTCATEKRGSNGRIVKHTTPKVVRPSFVEREVPDGSRALRIRTHAKFDVRISRYDARPPIRKAVPNFCATGILKRPGILDNEKQAEASKRDREEDFLGALDAHGNAIQGTIVNSSERASSRSKGRAGEASSTFRPFSSGSDGIGHDSSLDHLVERADAEARGREPYMVHRDSSKENLSDPNLDALPSRVDSLIGDHVEASESQQQRKIPDRLKWTPSWNKDSWILPTYYADIKHAIHPRSFRSPVGHRLIHTSSRRTQQAVATAPADDLDDPPPVRFHSTVKTNKHSRIRQELRSWQDSNFNPEDTKPQPIFDTDNISSSDGVMNSISRLPDMQSLHRQREQEEEDERAAIAHFSSNTKDSMAAENGGGVDNVFLNVGDLVELEFIGSDRNSILAVFVRRMPGGVSQFFTMQGRWVFMKEREIMWTLPRWATEAEIEPLLKYLPTPEDLSGMDELLAQARVQDLSIPRSVSAPLVTRLNRFWTESQDFYRKYSGVLDDAHNLLAHETDLRYGSLVSAATTLLQIPAKELPATALYAVRSALSRAGFGFNVDRKSHRMTGYLQIRSKEHFRMVQCVRDWIREWQDDVATRTSLEAAGQEAALRKHRTSRRAKYIYSFLEKTRKIVLKSRENRRAPLPGTGNIGPSSKSFPIAEDSEAVRVTQDTQFNEQDTEILRFIEGWSCSYLLLGLTTLESLPPMLMQATGLYDDQPRLGQSVGFIFLQELGTLMPYENRIRFDPHLLLPSSQHSKPLQTLMTSLIDMQHNHKFTDSMRGLRKDWGSLPVYCVDGAGAQEIDDGVSIQQVDGREGEYWLHTHVANPTAFFERDHPLAKMARHMGESIYMPERAYMMLPRWATGRHFSLAKGRPCLTFSTRVDTEGKVKERAITPGIVQNVINLTPDEVSTLLGVDSTNSDFGIVLTVGGSPPPPRERKSMASKVTADMVQELKTMRKLADKLTKIREARGGIIFDHDLLEVAVWQSTKGAGLAWDQPYRRGSRTVEGDPVIQLKTNRLSNWFNPKTRVGSSMVQEMMLLAGETAASWCSERGIPTVFRGMTTRPDSPNPVDFHRDVIAPVMQRTGEMPLHIGLRYLSILGRTTLRTQPLSHTIMGLQQYVKATSPLRRYGDMIVHWQIQAALHEEARRGRSLTRQDIEKDATFLPFSANVLETIMLGLGPRESLIQRSSMYATNFWISLLLFRAYHFGECELPFAANMDEHLATGKPLAHTFLHTASVEAGHLGGIFVPLNISCTMLNPMQIGLEAPRQGDVWEVEFDTVDCYRRTIFAKPTRLVERQEEIDEKYRH